MGIGNHRAHFVLFFAAHTSRPDFQRFHQRLQTCNQLIRRFIAYRDHDRQRHAALARRTKRPAHNRIHRGIQIRIRHHNRVVFRCAKGLHAFAVGAGSFVDIFGNTGRAHEADRRNTRIGIQLLGIVVAAVHNVKDAIRQACFLQQFSQAYRGRRGQRRWLEDEAVAAGQRQREHPHRHHRREVKRRNPRHNTQRLHQRIAVHAGADIRGVFTFNQMWNTASKFNHFQTTCQLAQCVRPDFTVLANDDSRQFFSMLLKQHFKVEQDAGAA